MNCLEFRRNYTAEPSSMRSEMNSHLATCHECQQFIFKQTAFEKALKESMNIDVPDGLASRILLKQSFEQPATSKRPKFYALAASLLLTISISAGIFMTREPLATDALVLNHINNELNHLQDNRDLQLAQLNNVLGQIGARATSKPFVVNYAAPCKMRKDKGAHLVVQGKTAPVTVLVMPGEFVAHTVAINDDHFHGTIIPTSSGSMAIVGENNDDVREIKNKISSTLSFVS